MNILAQNMIFVWLFIIIFFAVLEAMTVGMAAITFSIAGFFAMFAAIFGFSLVVQLAVFVVVLALSLYYLIPVLRKLAKLDVKDESKYVKTNLDLVVGEKAQVLAEISYLKDGLVKVDGKEWTAKTDKKDAVHKVGEFVTIKEIRGSKVVVE